MGDFIKKMLSQKRFLVMLLSYSIGVLTIPLLQVAVHDIGQAILTILPHVVVILVILVGVPAVLSETLQKSQKNQLMQQVMRDIFSHNQQVVMDAMMIITDHDWHIGDNSFLHGLEAESVQWHDLHLNGANLTGANLFRVNLENTFLEHADLRHAEISMANFQDTKLSYSDMSEGRFLTSNFRGTNLHGTICKNARFAHSDFGGAILMGTDLCGADLTRVNLQGARFIQYAKFDQDTILPTAKLISPDGQRNKVLNLRWHPKFDWTPYQTGEAYRGYSDEWKQQMGWIDPSHMPVIDEDIQGYLA